MKRHAPATARNAQVIAQVMAQELPGQGTVLEIASGTGEHAVFMARQFPALAWQPSDADEQALASIAAYREEGSLPNLRAPVRLDASVQEWPALKADAIVCINMVHIAPWTATTGLFRGAAAFLSQGEPLILYGPYIEAEVETAPSNVSFDESLRARDARWGLRHVAEVDTLAKSHGFGRTARHTMPANNLTLVYRRA